MGYKYDYSKLKGRIVEKLKNQGNFTELMKLSGQTISQKLKGNIEFKQSEIQRDCEILDIPLIEIKEYFFSQKS